ncbi:hypothetical protein HN51_034741 [Arachis hypogaea]|uniref:NAD-dependent epimerase/dehydratase domain-containing protein n=1 Tax=Arachis hypogaea TaxID=3818 RepID=A0A445A7C6_ARAHY|nr:tetraketide alpha-pyrone reductase 1 [Arachis hypogaea]QHN99600.1 Tetraketide alpha-pyrone reductase [Arachis hypogaea]RYR22340.1 hypothetical protein Ahy_B03g067633 isoform B [Arachis hypogaea]
MSNSIAGIGTGNGNGKVVCVTGASGYIASWIVNLLLQRGYTVRATLRDPSNPKKLDHLLKLHGAKERLQIFKADLLEDGSFDSAIDGCDGVFHTASPVTLRVVNDPQAELIDPAVKGTLNVLQSCAKSPSVKRVVLTSSISAVLFTDRPLTPDVVVDETWFSDADNCTKLERWYSLSKTLAEDAAWKFANKNGIDMVSILPSMVAGPLLQPEVNESVEPILSIINGAPFPNRVFGWVNVKDVAIAHIQAYEIPTASGRYLIVERVVHYSEHARILHDLYPTLQIKDKCEDDKPFVPTYQVSKEKAESLGIEFTPLEVTLKETVESFREKNIVNF